MIVRSAFRYHSANSKRLYSGHYTVTDYVRISCVEHKRYDLVKALQGREYILLLSLRDTGEFLVTLTHVNIRICINLLSLCRFRFHLSFNVNVPNNVKYYFGLATQHFLPSPVTLRSPVNRACGVVLMLRVVG